MSQHSDEEWWDLQESFTEKCKEVNYLAGSVSILKKDLKSEKAKRKKAEHERNEQLLQDLENLIETWRDEPQPCLQGGCDMAANMLEGLLEVYQEEKE